MSDTSTTTATSATDNGDGKPTDDGQLGDAGQKALAAERDARRAADKAAKDAQRRADDLQKQIDDLKAGSMSEHEKALEQARKEAADQATKDVTAKFNTRLVTAEIRSAAAGKLADPADAVKLIDLDDLKVDSEGNVDQKSLAKAIDELIKEKPYLAATSNGGPGKGDGGPRGGAAPAGDWLRNATGRK